MINLQQHSIGSADNTNLNEVAKKLNGNIWKKGIEKGIYRVYLNDGYNTKKVKQTIYIQFDEILSEQEWKASKDLWYTGAKVSVFTETTAQRWRWCKEQSHIKRDAILKKIQSLIQQEIPALAEVLAKERKVTAPEE